jgi:hypothetical protein
MTLFLEFFLMLALYYMYSIQSQMIRLLENQMDHLHELNLLLVNVEEEEEEDEDVCDHEEDEDVCDDEDNEDVCDLEDNEEDVCENEGVDKQEDADDDKCLTCNRIDEKCRCPNPYKLLSKKTL